MFLPYLQIDKSSRLYSNIHTDLNCECEVNTFTGNFKTQRIVVVFSIYCLGAWHLQLHTEFSS